MSSYQNCFFFVGRASFFEIWSSSSIFQMHLIKWFCNHRYLNGINYNDLPLLVLGWVRFWVCEIMGILNVNPGIGWKTVGYHMPWFHKYSCRFLPDSWNPDSSDLNDDSLWLQWSQVFCAEAEQNQRKKKSHLLSIWLTPKENCT